MVKARAVLATVDREVLHTHLICARSEFKLPRQNPGPAEFSSILRPVQALPNCPQTNFKPLSNLFQPSFNPLSKRNQKAFKNQSSPSAFTPQNPSLFA
jgi:hypothetical protein